MACEIMTISGLTNRFCTGSFLPTPMTFDRLHDSYRLWAGTEDPGCARGIVLAGVKNLAGRLFQAL